MAHCKHRPSAAAAAAGGDHSTTDRARNSTRRGLLQFGADRGLRGDCPELVPLHFDDPNGFHVPDAFQVSSSGNVSVFFEAWCSMSPLGGLALAPCGAHAHFDAIDDRLAVSKAEAQLT
eukprot:gene53302-14148_t